MISVHMAVRYYGNENVLGMVNDTLTSSDAPVIKGELPFIYNLLCTSTCPRLSQFGD